MTAELRGALERAAEHAAKLPALRLLVLHGSRARGGQHPGSDWDFAYLDDGSPDPLELCAGLAAAVQSERVDLADLARAGALLRYRVARDGLLVYERPGEMWRFWEDAVRFWCDAGPLLEQGYDAVLAGLDEPLGKGWPVAPSSGLRGPPHAGTRAGT